MPMDATDTKLLKGMVAFAVLGLMVYYYPFSWPLQSYKDQIDNLDQTRQQIAETKKTHELYFGPQSPRVWDPEAPEMDILPVDSKETMASRKLEFEAAIGKLRKSINDLQESSRMKFAPWTDVPAEEANPGHYFTYKWDRLRLEMDKAARSAGVEIMDQDIGFSRFVRSDVHTMSRPRADELLRELYITETIIRLAIKAKSDQEQEERKKSLKPEAFMRIREVTPQDSDTSGPVVFTLNPRFDPTVKDPRDERFKKYITRQYPHFIRQYPVEILLQCDVNSFMKFLQAVRTPGQFLVIRKLEIVSPFMADSQRDKSDLVKILGDNPMNALDYKDEHIWARISAAGMDFFEPVDAKGVASAGDEDTPEMFRKPAKGQHVEPSGH